MSEAAQSVSKSGGTAAVTQAKLAVNVSEPITSKAAGGKIGLKTAGELTSGAIVASSLETGAPTMADGSFYEAWKYEGVRGETITVRMRSDDFDTHLMILDGETSQVVGNNDDDGYGKNSRLTLTLPLNGPYLVVSNSYDPGARGAYELLLLNSGVDDSNFDEIVGGLDFPTGGDPAERYALVIGIGDYPGSARDLPVGPVQDADAMADLLRNRFGFRDENIVVLKDSAATRGNIINGIRTHLGQAGPEGAAVLTYSGHGTQAENRADPAGEIDVEPDGRDEALVAYDALVIDDEIGMLVDELRAERVLLIYDSCFSGRGSRAEGIYPKRVDLNYLSPYLYTPKSRPTDSAPTTTEASAIELLRDPVNHVLLASSRETEISYSLGVLGGNSVFTYYLVDALRSASDDVPLSDIVADVREQTLLLVDQVVSATQTPQAEGQKVSESVGFFLGERGSRRR